VALTASWRKDFLTEQRTKRDRLAELAPETALRESALRQGGEMEMEPEEEEQRLELKLESLRRKFESVRREHKMSDEQFEQFKNSVEFASLINDERAKKIHELLESGDSRDRNNAILEIFGYTDDRAIELFGKLLPALEDLRANIDDLRAKVEALKQQKPFLARLWSKKSAAKTS